jgi:electron transfer flavoprotein alpha subunit
MSKTILVLAEVPNGSLRSISFELISAAQSISEEDGKVIAVILGNDLQKDLGDQLIFHGADEVYFVNKSELATFTTDGFTQAFTQLIQQIQPDGVLMGHTAVGKDIAPRIASRLNLGLITDVMNIRKEEESILFTRPIYAGKAFQTRKIKSGLVFATVRPNNIQANDPDTSREGELHYFNAEVKDIRTVIKDIVRKTTKGVDLSEAKIIVSGGRGVKKSEGFEPLYELAEVLGAAVGASRGACDGGFCDYSMQIGQTGKVVTPHLYIACGISGAIQHLAGMSNSKIIVAINKDPDAPIFKVADYGIVGDLFEVVPLLTEEFKKILAEEPVS